MNGIAIDATNETARIGAGCLLGDIAVALSKHRLALPAGSCRPVGVAGLGNVVELFICTTARPAQTPRPYYEFEVSPYNQELQVLIDINGKFNEKWNTRKFRHSATIRAGRPGWDAVMEIPLKELGWKGNPATITGNAFAILGAKGVRRFYSAYLPRQQKPNFHQPSFFRTFSLNDISSVKSVP
jgi:FAD/FMN-containing dehydrogenase